MTLAFAEMPDVVIAPSIAMQGGPAPEALLRRAGHDPGSGQARTLAVATTGLFVAWSLLPPPRGLPTLRPFQAAQAAVALDWLERIVG